MTDDKSVTQVEAVKIQCASSHRISTACRMRTPGKSGSQRPINASNVGTRLKLSYGSAIDTPRPTPLAFPPAIISTECVDTRRNAVGRLADQRCRDSLA